MSTALARSWMQRTGRVVGLLGWLVVVAGIGLLLVPTLLGFDRYVIVSGSMHPVLDRGSVVFSKAVDVEDLAVGDVITYTPPVESGVFHLVTHRITSITHDPDTGARIFRTKGDANAGADPWVFQLEAGEQNVMSFTVPFVGFAFITLADPHLRMLVIGIPAALIALVALADVVRVALGGPRLAET